MIVGGYFDATNSLFMQWSAQGALNFPTGSGIAADGNDLRWYLNTVTNQFVGVDRLNIIRYLFTAGSLAFANVGGVVNAYTASVSSITALVNGATFAGNITVGDNTGASTLNVSGTGAKAIVDQVGDPLTADDLRTNVTYIFIFNAPLDSWELAGVAPEQTPTLIGNVAVVSKLGNDATAVVGSWSNPFLTVQAAVDAASAGQSVFILSGDYMETVTSKVNVPIYGTDRKSVRITNLIISAAGNHSISNITIAAVLGDAIAINGAGAVIADFFNVRGRCGVAADSVVNYTNTSAGTVVNFIDSLFDNSAAGGKIIKSPVTSGGGKIFLLNTFTGNLFPDIITYSIDGAVNFETNGCLLIGQMSVLGSGSVTIFGTQLRTSSVVVADLTGLGATIFSNTSIDTAIVGSTVIGAGIFKYANISFLSTGFGYAQTLNGGTGATSISRNMLAGTIVLSGGPATVVPAPGVKVGAKIIFSIETPGGVPSGLSAPTALILAPGGAFTFVSAAPGDSSVINWMAINPTDIM